MKIKAFAEFLLIICVLLTLSCQPDTSDSVNNLQITPSSPSVAETNRIFDNFANSSVSPGNIKSNRKNPLPETKLKKIQPKSQLIWFGQISDSELKMLDQPIQIKDYEMMIKSPLDKMGIEIQVDVLNCGGYLFSAKASKYKVENFDFEKWKIEVIPNTIAPDAVEKIKQCNYLSREKEADNFYSETCAVAPSKDSRKNIKTQIDGRKVFASLPKWTKRWLDQKIVKNASDCCERSEKGTVSTMEQDSWVDLDGDGEIDWLKVYAIDKEKLERKGDSFTVEFFLRRAKGKWIES